MADLLNPDALHHNLDEFEGWDGTTSGIHKTYRFGDERSATAFVDQVMAIADRMNHHPEVSRTGNDVTLDLATHSAGGVTQLDFDLAQRIEEETGRAEAASPRSEG